MKRFQFALETALRVRRLESEVEEAKLLGLERERAECRRSMDQLATAARRRPGCLLSGDPVSPAQLEDMDRLSVFVKKERQRLTALEGALLHKIAVSRGQLKQAEQRVELLEGLKTKEKDHWRHEADKELQTQAEESYNHQFPMRIDSD